jgi:hypothetical protein
MVFNSMSSSSSLRFTLGGLVLLGVVTAQTVNPVQDIVLPASESASSPLE